VSIVARLTAAKRLELESFWRGHLEGWRRSDLNQREYCELHGLPLKRFGNWRAKFKHEDDVSRRKLLWRRGGGLRHMPGHMSNKETASAPATCIPKALATPPNGRRQFSKADKKRILAEIDHPGGSVSGVAKRYGISVPLLFRWKRELAAPPRTTFLPVTVTEGPTQSGRPAYDLQPAPTTPSPVIVERSTPGIEVELKGGRRVRFDRDTDPETVQRLVTLLEGEAR
jgi:transposase-like protein